MVPVVAVLRVAGFHVPVIPLLEVPGKAGAVAPTQSAPIGLKVGVTLALTVIVNALVVAH